MGAQEGRQLLPVLHGTAHLLVPGGPGGGGSGVCGGGTQVSAGVSWCMDGTGTGGLNRLPQCAVLRGNSGASLAGSPYLFTFNQKF